MSRLKNLPENTSEDFLDTLVSSFVFDEGQEQMKKIKESIGTGNKYIDEALEDALTGAIYQVMNEVTIIVTEYALMKSIAILTGLIAYIKGRSTTKKLQNGLKSFFNKAKSKGFIVGKGIGLVGNLLFGSENQTLAIAKMTNDTTNSILSNVAQERGNQILLKTSKMQRVDDTKDRYYSTYNSKNKDKLSMYTHKFKTASWTKTEKDKKLYFEVTGQDASKIMFNKEYVDNLNKMSNFVKTAKGEIYSNTKATLDLLTINGVSK